MNTMNDIRRLPSLYKQKDEIELQIKVQEEEVVHLENEAQKATASAEAKLRRFNEIIGIYKNMSREWWQNFFNQNSPQKLEQRIAELKQSISSEQAKIAEKKKIDNPNFAEDLKTFSSEMNKSSQLRDNFAQYAGNLARKAMCYDVCVYCDTDDWTLQPFNGNKDWGVHLCPKGISKSFFKKRFMITNPLAYSDIKKLAEHLPAKYKERLSSHLAVQYIIDKYHIKSKINPVSEMSEMLKQAKGEIAKANGNISRYQEEIKGLQELLSVVNVGSNSFMEQLFDDISLLKGYQNRYRHDTIEKLSKLQDYESQKILCSEMVQKVFDFKNVDHFASGKRYQLERAISDAPKEMQRQKLQVEGKLADMRKEYTDIRSQIELLQRNYEDILVEMTKEDPASTFFYPADGWINLRDSERRNFAVAQLEKMATERKSLERIPSYDYLNLGGTEKAFISDTEWQNGVDKAVNLIVKPLKEDAKTQDASLLAANNLLTAILLSLPIRKVHFTFIDFNASCNLHSKLFNRFNKHKNIYTVVRDMSGLYEVKNIYFQRTDNKENITEVIVWTNFISNDFVRIKDELIGILDDGASHGYYTIAVAMDNTTADDRVMEQIVQTCRDKKFKEIYAPGTDINSDRTIFLNAVEEYVDKESDTSHAAIIYQQSMENGTIFSETPIKIGEDGIKVEIGYDENNHGQAFYDFNVNNDIPHTFILGGSGSGKSYLLQNILLNAMLKYKAEELELYLMDFKMGAAEFRFYQNMPHVSHLLIDDADHQAVYEILNELYKEMEERGKKIKQYKTIVNYNEQHPEDRLPYIMLVVDECHKLFESDAADRKMQEAINHVISLIVKEGRSQGVTFIFATQTFAGMDIPAEIKNEARNKYLMKVTTNEDAEKLFDGGSQRNAYLSQGYAFHEAKKSFIHIYDYTKFSEKAKETILRNNQRPAGRNNFVFSGTDVYSLPTTDDLKLRYPIAYIGKSVSVKREDVAIPLRKDAGSHLLITGVNDELQAERVFFNAALSLARQTFGNGKRAHISIFDNPGDEDDRYELREDIFNTLEQFENVQIFRSKKERLREIARLGDVTRQENPDNDINILLILAEEKMRRLLMEELPVEKQPITKSVPTESVGSEMDSLRAKFGLPTTSSVLPQAVSASPSQNTHYANKRRPGTTMQDELMYILKEGGDSHVHIVMQVNQPGNILQDPNMVHRNDIRQWFSNIVMLKCSQEMQTKLPCDNIRLERLSASADMLRAIYVNEEGDAKMFTPYKMPDNK